jgi:hypothetical protein
MTTDATFMLSIASNITSFEPAPPNECEETQKWAELLWCDA